MKRTIAFFIFIFCTITSISYAQAPTMNPITGSSVVCSSPGVATMYNASANNSPTSYQWSVVPSSGVIIGNSSAASTSISFPYSNGTYTVYCSASNGFGTSTPVSYVVTVFETPTVTFSGSNMFCQGSSTNLQASSTILAASTTISYSWSPSAGLNTTTGPFVSASPTIPTTYTVTGTIGNCSSTSTIFVAGASSPVLTCTILSNPTCVGQPVVVNVSGANTYTFNGGIQNGVPFTPNTSGIIPVLVTGAFSNGCTDTLLTDINVIPSPTFSVSSSQPVLCPGSQAIIYVNGAANNYSLNSTPMIQTGAQSASITVSPTNTTTYTIIGQVNGGCTGTSVFTQSVSTCIGIKESVTDKNKLIVFPNPSNGTFIIRADDYAQATISNELGQIIRSFELKAGEDTSINDLSAGIYFISAGNVRTKIIVTR